MRQFYFLAFAYRKFYAFLILILAITCLHQEAAAQTAGNYVFSTTSTGSFTQDLNSNPVDMASGTTQLIGASTDQGTAVATNIGFSFSFAGTGYTQFSTCANGIMRLGSTAITTTTYNLGGSGLALIAPFAGDLETSNTGKVHYKLVGSSPNRTLVIEYLNMGIDYTGNYTSADGTYQVRLYETTNIIEFVYGPMFRNSSVLNSTGPFQIGISNNTGAANISSVSSTSANTIANAATTLTYTLGATIADLNSTADGSRKTYVFAPPPPCTAPLSQASALVFGAPAATNIQGNFTATAADKYLIVRTSGAALNALPVNGTAYSAGATLGNGTVVSFSNATTLSATGLNSNTNYTFTIFSANDATCAPGYNVTSPLIGSISTVNSVAYTWIPTSGSADAAVAANWNPARNTPDVSDTLYFSNGGSSTITNIATSTVVKIAVKNNTTIIASAGAAAATLSVTKDLSIDAGSTMDISGATSTLTVAFVAGNSPTATIAGTLNTSGTVATTFSVANSVTTVAATGAINVSNLGTVTGGSLTTLIFAPSSNYYHARNGGTIPTASYDAASIVNITGSTTTVATPAAKMGTVIYNCPLQTAVLSWSSTVDTIRGNLIIESTGTSRIEGGNNPDIQVIGKFKLNGGVYAVGNYTSGVGLLEITDSAILNGGTLLLNSSTTSGATYTFKALGHFTQAAGNTIDRLNTVAGTLAYISFAGSASQSVSVAGTINNNISYILNNAAGVVLTGTLPVNLSAVNTLTSGTYSGTGSFSYNATTSTVVYNGTTNQTAALLEFPVTNGPASLTVAKTAGIVLTVPFSRTIPGTLTMTSGDIDIAANTLTIGTSATTVGTLSWTAGSIRVTTGSLTRWYGTASLPIAAGTAVGYYPLANGTSNRNVSIYFSTATALTTGGSITVGHTSTPGTAPVLIVDGGYTVEQRTNSFWTVSQSGLVAGGTLGMRISTGGIISVNTVANLRLVQASAAAGTYVAGSGTAPNIQASRTGLTLTDIAQNHYVGAAGVDVSFMSIVSGAWENTSTWNKGTIPTATDAITIGAGTTVTVNATAANASSITTAGTLTVTGSTLTVATTIINNGIFNVNGGTITLGPIGGGNTTFANASGGTVNVTSGTLNVNGNLANAAGSFFNQSGGAIIIDGNSGTAATSVVTGTAMFSSTSTTNFNCTAGTITIVDPHHSSYTISTGNNRSINLANAAGNNYFSGTHTFILGDGVSTTIGTAEGFVVETYSGGLTSLNNLTVNGGNAIGRWTSGSNNNSTSYGLFIKGNLQINAGSEFRTTNATSRLEIAGNIVNNGVFTYAATGTNLILGSLSTNYTATSATTLSGTGLWANAVTTPTANFSNITVNNPLGVNISSDISISGTLLFTTGNINTGTNKIAILPSASISGASQTTGWVNGNLQRNFTTGANISRVYNIGTNNYAPVTLALQTVNSAGNIVISSTSNDHPNIGTSGLLSTKSINRYWTITSIGTVFTTADVTFNWQAADMDAAITTASLKVGRYASAAWTMPTVASPLATSIQATGISAFGDFAVAQQQVVPVTLVNFKGERLSGNINKLSWTTVTEINNAGFELERSADGFSFSSIAKVASKSLNGNSVSSINYEFNDVKPFVGNGYYRLKQLDKDGTVNYSQVVLIKGLKNLNVEITNVYPNPVKNDLHLVVTAPANDKAQLVIVDLSGRIVKQQSLNIVNGDNVFTMNVNGLAAGTYIVKAIANNGHETIGKTFVKQ